MNLRALSLIGVLLVSSVPLLAQSDLYAVVDGGTWSSNTSATYDMWSEDALAGAPTPGLRPTALDNVFTNGKLINVGPGATCKNLAVSYDGAGKLVFGSLLTVTGTLAGWDDVGRLPTAPTVNVFSGSPIIRYTAANLDGVNPFFLSSNEVIGFWNKNSPLGQGLFVLTQNCAIDGGDNFFGGDTELQFTSINISGGNQYELSTGSLLTGIRISGTSGSTLVVAANTRFNSNVPIYGTGATSSKFLGTTSVGGYLRTSSYLNATTVSISSAGTLETTFSGVDQSQGWWYQASNPTITASNGSTVIYSASTDQNVFLVNYSNLVVSGGGNKQLVGTAGTWNIGRSLTIATSTTFSSALATQINIGGDLICDGSWSPATAVSFNGTSPSVASQTVRGSGTLAFNTLQVNNTGISLILNKPSLTISNGINVVTNASLDLGSQTVNLSGGDIANAGTITSGSGTLSFTNAGSSDVTGAGTTTFNNLILSSGDVTFQVPVSFNNIVINSASASATFNGSTTVRGNITNSGTLGVATSSVLTFSGGNAQAINGNGFSVYDMIVNKSSNSLSNNSTINLLGNLTMTSGTFDADGSSNAGNFVLVSNTTRDATIGKMGGGQITGEVTFQRYFNNTVNRWRNMGFPVTSVTMSELASSITINRNSISYYQENAPGDVNQGWAYLADGNVIDKYGYSIYMYDIKPTTISVKGPLLQSVPADAGSKYDFGVTFTDDATQPSSQDGWNLVANPFAAPIDWNNANWVKDRVNAVATIWDASSGAYRYSGTAAWPGVIAQGQAVWVQTNGASPLLQCTEDVKVESVFDPTFYRTASKLSTEKGTRPEKLIIRLEQENIFDETVIAFNDESNEEFDNAFDAHKLRNQIFNLSSLTPAGLDLAINVLPKAACGKTLPLKISNIKSGSYAFRFDGLTTFSEGVSISLKDNFLGQEIVLSHGTTYEFTVTPDEESFSSRRFDLIFDFSENAGPVVTQNGRKLTTNIENSIQWFFNGEPIEGASKDQFIAVMPGAYHVQGLVGGCILSSEVVYVKPGPAGAVFPNPASDDIHVNVTGLVEDGGAGTIVLYSSKGEIVSRQAFKESEDVAVLDIKDHKPGLYLLKVFSGNRLIADERVVIK